MVGEQAANDVQVVLWVRHDVLASHRELVFVYDHKARAVGRLAVVPARRPRPDDHAQLIEIADEHRRSSRRSCSAVRETLPGWESCVETVLR